MLTFPKDRVYRRQRRWNRLKTIAVMALLALLLVLGWYYDDRFNQWGPVAVAGQKIVVADGDSFVIGDRKLRLKGIDAPEYRQNCKDTRGAEWQCGRAARAALEQHLLEPGLACEAEARDRYARSLASCRTARTPDIAAAQVRDGMAISDEYYGSRSFGDEEDSAQAAKRGIWQGEFTEPSIFRTSQR